MKRELEFIGLLDFYKKKDKIRIQYRELTKEEKRNYKMYIYSTAFSSEDAKDLMWEYLNEEIVYNNYMPTKITILLSNEVKKVRERSKRYERQYNDETAKLESNNRAE